MKRIILSLIAVLAFTAAIAGTVYGQTGGPPPPPPPPGGGINPPPAPGASATPTATATAVPTATPVPLTLNVKIGHKTRSLGQKQSVKITSLAGAAVKLSIKTFGFSWSYKKSTTLGSSGVKTYSFTQAGPKSGSTKYTATVKVTASLNGQTKHSTKKYTVT